MRLVAVVEVAREIAERQGDEVIMFEDEERRWNSFKRIG